MSDLTPANAISQRGRSGLVPSSASAKHVYSELSNSRKMPSRMMSPLLLGTCNETNDPLLTVTPSAAGMINRLGLDPRKATVVHMSIELRCA